MSLPLSLCFASYIVFPSDVPSPPKGPLKVLKVTEDLAELEWNKPESDGGSPILQYSIEIREARRTMWGRAGVVDDLHTKYTARSLVIGNEYSFRIRAINAEGESEPLDGEETVIPRKKTGKSIFPFYRTCEKCIFVLIT